jgi:AbrB family looped-hinge helix DNA binding protein
MTLRIDKFGRVLIPKLMRQSIGLQPGDDIIVEVLENEKSLKLSSKPEPENLEVRIEYTDWGFPQIVGGAPYPADFDFQNATKNGYDEYHKTRFGV